MTDNRPYKLARPKGLTEYILGKANKMYGLVDKSNNCYCTCCRKKSKIEEKLKQNETVACPECGHELIVKLSRYGKKNIEENGRVLWFTKRGKSTFAQLDEYDIDYSREEVRLWPSAQYKFSEKEIKFYKHDYRESDKWIDRKNIILPSATQGMIGWWQMAKYEKTYTYKPSIKKLGTDLKYQTMLETLSRDPFLAIKYLENFIKYPSIEVLEKSGFEDIVESKCRGRGTRNINWRKNNLRDVLKMNAGEIRELRKFKIINNESAIDIIDHYKGCIKDFKENISIRESLKIPNPRYHKKAMLMIQEHTSLKKAIEYVEKQETSLLIYADYIRECEQLERNLKKKEVLRPKKFIEEHEKTSAAIWIANNKETIEKFKNTAANYSEFNWNKGNLFIRVAEDPVELENESAQQGHCVRTYIPKVAEGKSAIFFIRKKESPKKSFYTLEFNDRQGIIQCYGKSNCSRTPEIEQFLKEWQEWMNGKKKKRKVA